MRQCLITLWSPKWNFKVLVKQLKKQTECLGIFSEIYTSTKPEYLNNSVPFEMTLNQSNIIQGTCHIELFPHCSPVS